MITIFNRKELFITYSMKEQARIRELLAANEIDYVVKMVNRMGNASAGRGMRTATSGTCAEENGMCEYKIYVHKKDYENAQHAMRR